ncbi:MULTISPECIES: SDR family NAD(P)-dependent oxidoreductase [unclassified Acidocella]|uniref:SDR family NAD(P)-dependent oxidoreductase n=1 Tax=unclassified Acidocella TaxID=2648610 RepID=UPI00028DBA85|nr:MULTISPECIES: glucose 1-dehydrogenase [unclassified Acidocella]EKM99673.1 putative short-chain dehydrogenase [Acidocella sp. MX-AZ02]WBO58309.1 SDR family oxidoreductase [Acidocella sp. MX-AZ03]
MRLKGKRVFITGAAGGIGRATAEKCAAEGARVVCADLRGEAAEAVAASIRAGGGEALAVAGDLTKEDACAAMIAQSVRHFGGLEVIFNNAGICRNDDAGPVETSLASWNATLAANLTSVFLCCKAAIPHLLASGNGVIINNASIVALVGSAFPQIAYTAAKGGVLAMTRELAIIYARQKLRAVAICPGPTATPLVKAFLADAEAWALRRRYIPMGRLAEPAEIANLVAFLASDDASFITGSAYTIDGGLTASYVIDDSQV